MAAKKAVAKRAASRKVAARGKNKVGDRYECGVCGLVVTVDEICGCEDVCDIICCSGPMKKKRTRK